MALLALYGLLASTASDSPRRRTVLVTGGARGIGAACCQRFAASGDRVLVHFRSDQRQAEAVRESLPGTGHAIIQSALDEAGAPGKLVADAMAAVSDYGEALDCMIINHGVYEEHPVETTSAADWSSSFERVLRTNLAAPAELAFAFGSAARENGRGGAVVFVSSRGAYRGEPIAAAYGASKAGLNSLTGSLAQAFGPHGIRVSAVAPGFIATEMAAEVHDPHLSPEICHKPLSPSCATLLARCSPLRAATMSAARARGDAWGHRKRWPPLCSTSQVRRAPGRRAQCSTATVRRTFIDTPSSPVPSTFCLYQHIRSRFMILRKNILTTRTLEPLERGLPRLVSRVSLRVFDVRRGSSVEAQPQAGFVVRRVSRGRALLRPFPERPVLCIITASHKCVKD